MIKKILIFLISVWLLLATISVGLNLINIPLEIKKWALLSEFDKKKAIFGEMYTFLDFASSRIPNGAKTLVFSEDIRISYFAIYVLYPKNIIVVYTPKEFNKKLSENDFKYILTYNTQMKDKRYKEIYKFMRKDSSDYGYIYKSNE